MLIPACRLFIERIERIQMIERIQELENGDVIITKTTACGPTETDEIYYTEPYRTINCVKALLISKEGLV